MNSRNSPTYHPDGRRLPGAAPAPPLFICGTGRVCRTPPPQSASEPYGAVGGRAGWGLRMGRAGQANPEELSPRYRKCG